MSCGFSLIFVACAFWCLYWLPSAGSFRYKSPRQRLSSIVMSPPWSATSWILLAFAPAEMNKHQQDYPFGLLLSVLWTQHLFYLEAQTNHIGYGNKARKWDNAVVFWQRIGECRKNTSSAGAFRMQYLVSGRNSCTTQETARILGQQKQGELGSVSKA